MKMPEECNGQRVVKSVANESGIQKSKINENNMKNLDRGFVVFNGKGLADGGSFMHDMKNNKFLEEDIKSRCWSHRRKSDVARERWKLLAKALLKPKKNCSKTVRDISVRRFTSFDLVTPNKLGEYPTDYWVSQEKKYCDFCKCYISANKSSVAFHESGQNHRDNVTKRLRAMQKKATKEAKDAANHEMEIMRIEAAALKAYRRDMEFNPDFSSRSMGKITIPYVPEPPKKSSKHKSHKFSHQKPAKKWMEAVAEDGTKYYWNVDTKESVWEEPEEGFMSLAEQKGRRRGPKGPKPKGGPGQSKFKKKFGKKGKRNFRKGKARAGKPKEGKEEKEEPLFFPIYTGHPYGKWEAVGEQSDKPVDLQLPQHEPAKVAVPEIKEDSDKKFEEKKIPAPGSIVSTSGETGFKKRKFSSDPKRNMRQRMDND